MNQQDKSKKIRVAVLFGGKSAEHEVSLKTAANVVANLDKHLFDVIPIGIDKKGRWFLANTHEKIDAQAQAFIPPNQATWFSPDWLVTKQKTEINNTVKAFDVVFPAVHGTLCEDGALQGLLESADIPYVGCGVLASAVGMDKDVAKRLAIQAGIPVAPYLALKLKDWQTKRDDIIAECITEFSLPVFVKPANTGSSIGISKAKTKDELINAIQLAFQFDTKILIEKALVVRELEIAVLESLSIHEAAEISVVGEIIPSHEFYSYDAKYLDENGATLVIPAKLSKECESKAREMAKSLFLALECEGMARVDLFLEKDTNTLYFNEINTLPGFTKISMYPQLMGATGVEYSQLLTHLIQLAMNRHNNKKNLTHSYQETLEKA